MPRKQRSSLKSFPIKRFSGMETKYSPITQKPGTLRYADGVNVVPLGNLSFGPNWQPAWGLTNFAALVTAALAGAEANQVHFVEVSNAGSTLLVAWDLKNNRPQGIWHVIGSGNPFATSTTTTNLTPTAHNHTANVSFTGGALPRDVIISDVGRTAGDRCVVDCTFPAVSGIVVSFYDSNQFNLDLFPLAVFTTDGVTLSGTFEFVFNPSGAWEYLQAQAPS